MVEGKSQNITARVRRNASGSSAVDDNNAPPGSNNLKEMIVNNNNTDNNDNNNNDGFSRRERRIRNKSSSTASSKLLRKSAGSMTISNTHSKQRGTMTNTKSGYYLWLFVAFLFLLALGDLAYLLTISNNAVQQQQPGSMNNHQVHGWNWSLPDLGGQRAPVLDLFHDRSFTGEDDNHDKGPIFKILRQAGVEPLKDLDQETIDALPTWSTIVRLFGDKPVIYGLEKCQWFRENTDPTIRFFGIAGTFNSGTNLLAELMIKNCQITERMKVYGPLSKGIRWQVPWGKHYPAYRRGTHVTDTDHEVPVSNSLPLVTIRDPYQWAQSMCRHMYTANWFHTDEHCPNLVPTEDDIKEFPWFKDKKYAPVRVKYAKDFVTRHDSLAHFYDEWYQLYYNATFPRIIVRFEDLLFHGQEVTETLCECGGGVPREDRVGGFQHISESAKLGTAAHGNKKTNLVGAIIRYGTDKHRLDRLTPEDLKAFREILDPTIMKKFRYEHPPTTATTTSTN